MNAIITRHELDFENAPGNHGHDVFKIGTCEGQWGCTDNCYYILSVINTSPGNGHLNDVFEWFEYSCKRDNKSLLVLEIFNIEFFYHLVSKRGFKVFHLTSRHCIKTFNKMAKKNYLNIGLAAIIKLNQ